MVSFVVLGLFLASAETANADRDPFVGAWEGIDPDGSFMTLSIGGVASGGYRFQWFDRGGTVCGVFDEAGNPIIPAMVEGTGTRIDADTVLLEVRAISCLYRDARGRAPVPLPPGGVSIAFDYDPATDTLTTIDVVWHRQGA